MELIIELRRNGILEKAGATYFQIRDNNEKFYAKTLDLEDCTIKEYTDLEVFYNKQNNETLYVVYNTTDLQILRLLRFNNSINIDDMKRVYINQDYMYRVYHTDKSGYGLLLREDNKADKIYNIARLLVTSYLPLKSFIHKKSQSIVLPINGYSKACYNWEIEDRNKLYAMISKAYKYKNKITDLRDKAKI